MIDIPRVTPEDGVSALVAHLEGEGCVIIERLASRDLLERSDVDLASALERVGTNNTEFAGRNTKRLNGVLSLVPATQELALHPTIIAMVERMLLPYCVRYQLNYDGIMHLMPGETAQDLHRDGLIYPFRHPAPPYTIACMWAQSEFTRENGGTCLVPGSHLWEQEREPRAREVVQAVMRAGSVVIYTGGVYHGAGANRSNTSPPVRVTYWSNVTDTVMVSPVAKKPALPGSETVISEMVGLATVDWLSTLGTPSWPVVNVLASLPAAS